LNRGIDIHFQSDGSESFPLSHHGMGTRSRSSLLTLNALISHQVDKNNPYHPLKAFIKLPDANRRFPPKIKKLFEVIAQKLNLPFVQNHEQN